MTIRYRLAPHKGHRALFVASENDMTYEFVKETPWEDFTSDEIAEQIREARRAFDRMTTAADRLKTAL